MREDKILRWIDENDKRYNIKAYWFVLESLKYTQNHFQKAKHVTGQELLVGLTRLARERFGPLAMDVLEEWGVRTSRDLGNIVFNLVSMGEVRKTEEDSIEDFDKGYDLKKELSQEVEMTG